MKTIVNGNVLEGAVLAAYTAKAVKADKSRQKRNMQRKGKRSYPPSAKSMQTGAYIREFFRLNRQTLCLVPCTYIIGGKEVVL